MEKAHMYTIFVVVLVFVRGAFAASDERIVEGLLSGSLDQELNRVTMTPETSTSTPAASVPPSFPAALLSISLDFLHVVSPLSLIWLSSCASMNQCTSAFMFLLILTFCIFILCLPVFLTRQPSCSPGKISLTAQRKSPSSMITRAYYKTLDKCQRGLRGGDLEDI